MVSQRLTNYCEKAIGVGFVLRTFTEYLGVCDRYSQDGLFTLKGTHAHGAQSVRSDC